MWFTYLCTYNYRSVSCLVSDEKLQKAERERERSAKEADLFKQLSKELGHSNGGHQPTQIELLQ